MLLSTQKPSERSMVSRIIVDSFNISTGQLELLSNSSTIT